MSPPQIWLTICSIICFEGYSRGRIQPKALETPRHYCTPMALPTNTAFVYHSCEITEDMNQDEWIDIEKQLPDKNILLIFGGGGHTEVGWRTDDGFVNYCGVPIGRVTHWQPLPLPPKATRS